MLKRLLRDHLPFSVRCKIRAVQEKCGWTLHQLRWQLLSAKQRKDYLERRLALSTSSWLFLNGMNNTGTTLLVAIFSTHPELRCLYREGHFITRALPDPRLPGAPRIFSTCLPMFRWTEDSLGGDPEKMMYDWAYYLPPPPGVLVEKSPTNVFRSRWLQRHFPHSAFLATARDPYAVCEGIRRRHGVPVEHAAAHWVVCHDALLDDLPHLQSKLLIRYEDLCAAPVRELQRVQDLLGLKQPFDEKVVYGEFPVHNLSNTSAAIQDFNSKSYANLTPREFDTITRIAGPTMEKLGYSCRHAAAA
ncbi:hypothetical protein AYO44_04295 [Planctomycetaceae bacterium SCGC AG-212-F19]|nr:hypothetical protein AYO44_04295 [Planctomycetaceae bacterium SCGC AG-212-F19]